MVLLLAIIFRVLLVANRAETPFYCYTCVGIAAMLIFQTIINIGMCMFVMPVIGITLPFFSYGGSSVVTLYMAMGLVSGIKKRTPTMRRTGRITR
jgi:rod shape determining protein RodA